MIQGLLTDGQPVDDTETKFSYQSVEFAVSLVVQDISAMDNRGMGSNIRNMIVAKPETVSVETDGQRYYISLPYEPLSGPDSVLSISAGYGFPPFNYHSSYQSYVRMLELKQDLISNGFYPAGDKYYFHNNPGESVLVSMIPSFSEYDDEDDFSFDSQHLFVVEKVLDLFQNTDRRLQDYLNNQNSQDERTSD